MIISKILTILSISLITIELFATFYQIRKSNIQNRIEYIVKLYNEFVNDENMIKMYYKLEYSEFIYNDNFHGSEEEKKLDKLLGYFSNKG